MNILKTNTANFIKPIGYQTPLAAPNKIIQNYQTGISFGQDCDVSKAYASPQINNGYPKARKIWNEFEKSNNIVILTHKFADGDAIGSGLALKHTLNEQFPDKNVDFIVPEGVPNFLKILPGTDSIITDKNWNPQDKNYLAVMVDCDERTVDGLEIFNNSETKINLDHHPSNKNLKVHNDLYLIKEGASSATEVLYEKLFRSLHIKPSKEAAECILIGLITDTGNFKYMKNPETTIRTKNRILNVLNSEGKPYKIETLHEKMDSNNKMSKELEATLVDITNDEKKNTVMSANGKTIDYFILTQDDIKNYNVKDSKVDIKTAINKFVNNRKKESDITAFLWETGEDDAIKLSMRSDNDNVRTFTEQFGGGGHNKAAGATFNGTVENVINQFETNVQSYNF